MTCRRGVPHGYTGTTARGAGPGTCEPKPWTCTTRRANTHHRSAWRKGREDAVRRGAERPVFWMKPARARYARHMCSTARAEEALPHAMQRPGRWSVHAMLRRPAADEAPHGSLSHLGKPWRRATAGEALHAVPGGAGGARRRIQGARLPAKLAKVGKSSFANAETVAEGGGKAATKRTQLSGSRRTRARRPWQLVRGPYSS